MFFSANKNLPVTSLNVTKTDETNGFTELPTMPKSSGAPPAVSGGRHGQLGGDRCGGGASAKEKGETFNVKVGLVSKIDSIYILRCLGGVSGFLLILG